MKLVSVAFLALAAVGQVHDNGLRALEECPKPEAGDPCVADHKPVKCGDKNCDYPNACDAKLAGFDVEDQCEEHPHPPHPPHHDICDPKTDEDCPKPPPAPCKPEETDEDCPPPPPGPALPQVSDANPETNAAKEDSAAAATNLGLAVSLATVAMAVLVV